MYERLLTKIRLVLITRMAKPEEVLIVEDENGAFRLFFLLRMMPHSPAWVVAGLGVCVSPVRYGRGYGTGRYGTNPCGLYVLARKGGTY